MSKPRTLKLVKLLSHKEQPILTIVGHGKTTFLWAGQGHQCFAFSEHGSKELYNFAQAIIRRVMPYKKQLGKVEVTL